MRSTRAYLLARRQLIGGAITCLPPLGRAFLASAIVPQEGRRVVVSALASTVDRHDRDAPRVRVDPLAQTVLGSTYRLDAPLARGGMGTLYRATHLRLHRPVAVKVLASAFALSDTARRRFMREARALARVRSPRVVEVLDVLETSDGRPALVTELLEGEDLGQRIARDGMLSVVDALVMVAELADALAVVHAAGIVHRDVKPSNVFLMQGREGERPSVKLLDFGVAHLDNDSPITRTGVALGTPLYMAPEQARAASAADERSDVYGIGAVLYHAVTGEAPYPNGNATEALARVLDGPPPPPSRRRSDLPAGVEELVLRAMARDPAARFGSAADLAERARQMLRRLRPRRPAPTSRPRRHAHLAWAVGGTALAVATWASAAPWRWAAAFVTGVCMVAVLRRWPRIATPWALFALCGWTTFGAVFALGDLMALSQHGTTRWLLSLAVALGSWLAVSQTRKTRVEPATPSARDSGSTASPPDRSTSRPTSQRGSPLASVPVKNSAVPASPRTGTASPLESSNHHQRPSPSARRPSARRSTTGSANAGY